MGYESVRNMGFNVNHTPFRIRVGEEIAEGAIMISPSVQLSIQLVQ